jgi:hypothetical protein
MADDGSGMGFMGFILGGVVVVLAIVAFAMYSGQTGGPSKTVVGIEMPKAPAK